MADLVISIPDDKVDRVRLAFGRVNLMGVRVPASVADIKATLVAYVQGVMVNYEASVAAEAVQQKEGKSWLSTSIEPNSTR